MISFLTSTLGTASLRAEVRDTASLKFTCDGMAKDGLDPEKWLLIDELTLRDLNKDAKAKTIAEGFLQQAQSSVDLVTRSLNEANKAKWESDKQLYNLQVKNYELDNPPWYKSALFWGPTGFILGAISIVVGGAVLIQYTR